MAQKRLILVGGPNGAGKSTFVERLLRDQPMTYLCADVIAKEMSPEHPELAAIAAGREFVLRLAQLLQQQESFIIESTLAGKSLCRSLEQATLQGFQISMLFVFTDGADTCIARVAERVRKGGHHVPEVDVRRRFSRSLSNFWKTYRTLADEWTLMYNSSVNSIRVAYYEDSHLIVHSEELLTKFWTLAGVVR